jgi:hypothetical protein
VPRKSIRGSREIVKELGLGKYAMAKGLGSKVNSGN